MTPELRRELVTDANDFMTPAWAGDEVPTFTEWLEASGTMEADGITEEEAQEIWAEASLLPPVVRKPEPPLQQCPPLAEEFKKSLKKKIKFLREQFSDITDAQIVHELRASCHGVQHLDGLDEQLMEVVKAAKASQFSGRSGKRRATRVAPLSVSRVQLRFYPDYFLDENGQVYDAEGMIVTPRFRNQRHWIRLKDHTGKRCERNVYWLMVGAGFVPDPMGRSAQEVSEATAKGKGKG